MPTVREIITATASYYSIPASKMLERNRHPDVAKSRHVAMYLARKHTNRPLSVIARVFDDMHHTTVLHAERKIKRRLVGLPPLVREISEIEMLLQLNSTTG